MNGGSADASVLIVGAGPTGLTLANVLARYGVRARLVERRAALSRHTKATNLMQRNQELMAALGLMPALAASGGMMRRLMVHAYGKGFGPRTMRLKESPFTDVLLCGQDAFERVAAEGLAQAGGAVEFGTELVDLRQDGPGVVATLAKGGRHETARFAYAVGCDGHDGVSRRFTRLDFTQQKTGVAIRQVDARLTWRRLGSMEQMWLFYFDRGFAVVVPLPGGVHRILTIEPKPAIPEREPTLEEMQAKLRAVAADPSMTLSDPTWFSYTDLSMGLAPGLRDGRVFLAGDVGNPVLPNGGQGMNTGIADAYDLGWKLAAVMRHGAPDALLDTYDAERHALRAALQKAQHASLKYTALSTPKPMQAAFRLFAEPALHLGGEYRMAQAFSELALNTRKSPLTLELAPGGGVRAGDRALDAPVVHEGRELRLYDRLYGGGWTLLAFGGRGRHADLPRVGAAVARLRRPDLSTLVLTTSTCPQDAPGLVYDLDEEAHRIYGCRKPRLLLVRPDGHVAARLPPGAADRLSAYLDRWAPDTSQALARVHATKVRILEAG